MSKRDKKLEPFRPEVICGKCKRIRVLLNEVIDPTGMSQSEIATTIFSLVVRQGWVIEGAQEKNRYAVCPKCQDVDAKLAGPPPAFDPNARCPKCGYDVVGIAYNGGIKFDPHQRQDFLERKCGRCGYTWKEKPLDASGEAERPDSTLPHPQSQAEIGRRAT